MNISYLKNGKIYSAEKSNEDICIKRNTDSALKTATITANTKVTLLSAYEKAKYTFDRNDEIFMNGYQSWTDTKEFGVSDVQKNLDRMPSFLTEKYSFRASGDQSFYTPSANLHGFDFCYIKGINPLFIGNHNYRNAYLIIEADTKNNSIILRSDIRGKILEAGDEFTVFEYELTHSSEEAVRKFFSNLKPRSSRKLFGYTSWYNHYQNISSEIIEKALDEADPRFELFQIDDGFEPFVGDWLETDRKKFPEGLGPVVSKIHEKEMLAGIWLAPLAAETKSALFTEHPEYIRKDSSGNPVKAGANWSGFYALDLENPEVIEYIRKVLRFYVNLGFDFFKLDFLYASNLSPIKGKTRSETAEYIYSIFREELEGKLILGCGATLSNAFEKFDYMRIGPDVSLKFDDVFYMRYMHRERISTKTTIQNTVYRSFMNGHAFMNDPDVFLLRDDNISMSNEQKKALITVNSLFGSLMMTSDNPLTYSRGKKKLLDKSLDMFRNAEVISYKKIKNDICVRYRFRGTEYSICYDTRKGVLING